MPDSQHGNMQAPQVCEAEQILRRFGMDLFRADSKEDLGAFMKISNQ